MSNRIRRRTDFSFSRSPLRSQRGTDRMPGLSSATGRHVWPAKSSFSDISYSCTSILSRASSGTVSGNVNSSSQTGLQLSSIVFVLFIISSAGAPAIPTCVVWKIDKNQDLNMPIQLQNGLMLAFMFRVSCFKRRSRDQPAYPHVEVGW